MDKKIKTLKALRIVFYILSFPLYLLLCFLSAYRVAKLGESYGVMAWVGIILAGVFAITMAIIITAFEISYKKHPSKLRIKRQTTKFVIASVALLAGLMVILDIAMPPVLPGPTSNTIYWEDLTDDYLSRAQLNADLLNEFIARNVANGNLGSTPLAPDGSNVEQVNALIKNYQKEGVRNKQVANLIAVTMNSLDNSGYKTFLGPTIDMANDGRMTVNNILYLVLGQRQPYTEEGETQRTEWDDFPVYDAQTGTVVMVNTIQWTVLDMMGSPMEVDLSGIIGTAGLRSFLIQTLFAESDTVKLGPLTITKDNFEEIMEKGVSPLIPSVYNLLDSILINVSDAASSTAIAGDKIDVKLTDSDGNTNATYTYKNGQWVGKRTHFNKDATTLQIVPSNEERGVLDYQSAAWLNANGLVFALCSVASIRNVCYVFSAVTALMAIIIGYVREKEFDIFYGPKETTETEVILVEDVEV